MVRVKLKPAARYLLVAACAVLLLALAVRGAVLRLRTTAGVGAEQPVPVKVVRCEQGRVEKKVRLVGALVPSHTVPLGPKTAGRVSRVLVQVGDRVEKGDLVAVLEAGELEAQVRQAEAALAAARADLARVEKGATAEELRRLEAAVSQAQAAADAARAAYERAKPLFDAGVISRQQYEQAETQLRVSEAQLEQARAALDAARAGATPEVAAAAEARVRQAQAALDLARTALSGAEVRAPMAGVVCETRGEPGELVAAGTPLAVLAVTDPLLLELNLPEQLAGALEPGKEVTVKVAAAGDLSVQAKTLWVAPAASAQTRLFRARLEVPNPEGRLKPGMFAEAYVVEQAAEGLVVPQEAVLTADGGARVFVVEEGVARERPVEVLVTDGTRAALRPATPAATPGEGTAPAEGTGAGQGPAQPQGRPLSPGDAVVVSGQELLSDGTPVTVVEGAE